MTAKKPYLMLAVTLLVSACSVGPNMQNPVLPEVKSYTAQDERLSLQQRLTLGDQLSAEWWTLFASKPLNDLLQQAIANNYDLAAARETLAQAEEAVKAGNGALLPQVSLGAAAGRQKYGAALFGPANFNIPPFSYYELGPSLSWTPDLFGGAHRALERQQALADYQAHQLDAAYVTLTGNTVAATLALAAANDEITALERILAEDGSMLKLVQASYAAGAATRVDVLSAQTRIIADQALLPPLQQRLSASRHTLAILIGKAPANWTPANFKLRDFTLPASLPTSLPSELIQKRPDILAAQANLHAASAAIGVASANLYPQITLTANMLQEALTPVGLFQSASNAWAVAAGLSAPIFNGGMLSAEKRAAEHAYQAALAQYQQTILIAFGAVADALTALDHDDNAFMLRKNAVDAAVATLDMAGASYRAGASGLVQVQDARLALAKTQLELIRAQQQRYLDCVRLFVAVGGSPVAGQG